MAGPFRTRSGRLPSETARAAGERGFADIAVEMYREGKDIIAASLPLVPVDTGALRSSAYFAEPVIENGHIRQEVGYGGVATKINPKTGEPTNTYALQVHENLQAHHVTGQAKYLQVPFDAAMSGMTDRIVRGVRRRDAAIAFGISEGEENASG